MRPHFPIDVVHSVSALLNLLEGEQLERVQVEFDEDVLELGKYEKLLPNLYDLLGLLGYWFCLCHGLLGGGGGDCRCLFYAGRA